MRLLCCFLLALLLGCHSLKKEGADPVAFQETNSLSRLAPLLADPECQRHPVATPIDALQGLELKNGLVEPFRLSTSQMFGAPLAQTAVVKQVLMPSQGEHLVALNLCRREAVYPLDSLETAALTVTAFVARYFAFYDGLGQSARLDPISVTLFPQGRLDSSESAYDNMMFVGGEDPQLVVYPTSERARQLNRSNLWESPWAVAHELSHYILNQRMRYRVGPINTVARGSEGQLDVMAGLHEGFADLLGFYAMNESAEVFAGFGCFQLNRDPSSAVFYDGNVKRFDETLIVKLFTGAAADDGLVSVEPSVQCQRINYHAKHIFGGVVAHTVYDLSHSGSWVNKASKDRAAALLSWAQVLTSLQLLSEPQEVMRESMRMAVETFGAKRDQDDAEWCRALAKNYPAFLEEWKNRGVLDRINCKS